MTKPTVAMMIALEHKVAMLEAENNGLVRMLEIKNEQIAGLTSSYEAIHKIVTLYMKTIHEDKIICLPDRTTDEPTVDGDEETKLVRFG